MSKIDIDKFVEHLVKLGALDCNAVQSALFAQGLIFCNYKIQKFKESSPTQVEVDTCNIESKFKIEKDKWYVCINTFVLRGKIVAIKGQTYQAEKDNIIKGENGCLFIDMHDGKASDYFRPWTIADAKNGDVLINDFNMIFIFKEIINNICISSYSVIERENDVILNSIVETEIGDINLVKFLPASTEQRELLFQKMHEAGYTFDFEKKELKKIEDKPLVIDEGKSEMDYCFTKMMNGEKVSSTWSEEDEKMVKDIIAAIDTLYYHGMVKWLKSLKQRFAWKPSDEQMKVLLSEVKGWTKDCPKQKVLESLYNDLIKLKGE